PGGANLPIYDALHKSSIRHILARHEQGAGFIAQGIARTTGRAAVCMGTSGPGSTNLLTAIADAKLDSVPVIAITGQVPTAMIGSNAFQEVDTFGLTQPITKANFLVRKAKDLLNIIPEAFEIATSGRPGPVAIDVPKDVQCEDVEFDEWPEPWSRQPPPAFNFATIVEIAEMIHQAERPVLYVGGGVVASAAAEALTLLARKNSIPIASTLMGLGCFPPDDPLFLGMLGMHGMEYCNVVLEEADLLLALGVRFDDRATGNAKEFCPQASIIHIDIDRSEIDKIKSTKLSVVGDVNQILQALLPIVKNDNRQEWRRYIHLKKAEYPFMSPKNSNPLNPLNLIRLISELVEPDTIISTDVGQHQMWTAQIYPFRRPRTLLTSGGLGTMGFGMPAAIGAALANPDKRVVCISG
ncbi:MAG: biosynthetic-type acetolactate synthase large subunit, partial [FCB group bacterium]|nr:biosynthetic-type acetolactate synthase large subunit [FCB group bacterium]